MKFQDSLKNKNIFTVTLEVVPGRGADEQAQQDAIAFAKWVARDDRVHAVTFTDSPGGNPAISAGELGREILNMGIEPLIHYSTKDRNRIEFESELYGYARNHLETLLIMTGDYQKDGYGGGAKPVFDIDPIHALDLINQMNDGLEYRNGAKVVKNKPTHFFAGCVVSPFKRTEAEVMTQYYKLEKKIKAGHAKFVVTQLGYDMRKFQELLMYMKERHLDVPVIGNIFVLTFGLAKMIYHNDFPGCVMTEKMYREMEALRDNSSDKGRLSNLDRAAKMYAIMKGLGFAGVHIGGQCLNAERLDYILTKGEEYFGHWQDFLSEFDYPLENGFYYYMKDDATGLNLPQKAEHGDAKKYRPASPLYHLSNLVHKVAFVPQKGLFPLIRRSYMKLDQKNAKDRFHGPEHIAKMLLYDCKDCGDCVLPNIAFLCPMSRCPKTQRNGPCGGSRDGWCEVHYGKRKCIYVRAYERLKKSHREHELKDVIVPPCDWKLYQTSSLGNYYLGRDHDGERLKIPHVPSKD